MAAPDPRGRPRNNDELQSERITVPMRAWQWTLVEQEAARCNISLSALARSAIFAAIIPSTAGPKRPGSALPQRPELVPAVHEQLRKVADRVIERAHTLGYFDNSSSCIRFSEWLQDQAERVREQKELRKDLRPVSAQKMERRLSFRVTPTVDEWLRTLCNQIADCPLATWLRSKIVQGIRLNEGFDSTVRICTRVQDRVPSAVACDDDIQLLLDAAKQAHQFVRQETARRPSRG